MRGPLRIIDVDRLQSAYRVWLGPGGNGCEWLGLDGGKEVVLTEEPDSSAWLRLKSLLLRPFVPESLL